MRAEFIKTVIHKLNIVENAGRMGLVKSSFFQTFNFYVKEMDGYIRYEVGSISICYIANKDKQLELETFSEYRIHESSIDFFRDTKAEMLIDLASQLLTSHLVRVKDSVGNKINNSDFRGLEIPPLWDAEKVRAVLYRDFRIIFE